MDLNEFRKTKIVATLGPASLDMISELIEAGVNVFRLNFSHGTQEQHAETVKKIREIEQASKSDKKMGLDKPKTGSIIQKGPTFQKVSIKCMSCGKGFEVAPALVPPESSRFKCNTCSCSAG